MELQRLVIDDPTDPVSLDLHPGLTVAFHHDPAARRRVVDRLVEAMGPAPSGVHLELVDDRQHHLVVFRPHGSAHRIVDVGAGVEVGGRYRLPDGRVSLLNGVTFDPVHTRRLLCIGATDDGAGADEHAEQHLARRLAQVGPEVLWPAAADLQRRTADLDALLADLPVRDVGVLASLDELATLHERCERTRRSHRPMQVAGAILAAVCAAAGGALFAVPKLAGGDAFTPTALLALAVFATLVAAVDLASTNRHARRERRVLAAAGIDDTAGLAARLGPLTDSVRRRAVLDAAEAHREAAARWYALTGGAPLEWTVRHRDRIALLAARGGAVSAVGVAETGTARPDEQLRAIAERIGTLRHAGPTAGALPLLLEAPFDGLAPEPRQRLLNGVRHLAATHQIVLVTGDEAIATWAAEPSVAASVGFVRLAPAHHDTAAADTASPAARRRVAPPRDRVLDGAPLRPVSGASPVPVG